MSTLKSENLKKIIIDAISNCESNKITFAEYMNIVLYDPNYGYYSSGTVKIGAKGDFFTSSSLSSDFGELLASQFAEMWDILGKPSPFMLVEMGAGTGLLADDILNYLEVNHQELFENLEYLIIEQAQALIKEQQNLLQKWLDKNINICWKTWLEIEDNSIIGCCFSNELVDAFGVNRVIIENGLLKEIFVSKVADDLVEIKAEPSTEKLLNYFELVKIPFPSNIYPEGYSTEVNLAALDWLETLAKKLQTGYIVTIDYGYTAQKYYHPQRYQGTLQCYYQHQHHSNPYVNLGEQDITAHVDFTALEKKGELCGLEKVGETKQAMFLMALGIGDRLNSSSRVNLNLALKRRDAIHQLINPTGLGGFGVLVQSKSLTEKQRSYKLKGLNIPA